MSPEQTQLQASAPTTRFPSPIPEIVLSSQPLSPKQPLSRKHSDSYRSAPKPSSTQTTTPVRRHKVTPPTGPFSYILSKESVSSPKELAQVREMEEDIAKLIDQDSLKPLTHMTYRRWKHRVEESPQRMRSLDQLYAQKLAGMEKFTRREADRQQLDLVSLKNKMMEMVAVTTSAPNSMAQAVGRMLLERLHTKKVTSSTAKINAIKEKITRKRSVELNKTAGARVARSMVDYAARTIDNLKTTSRQLKQQWETEQA